jgi:phosphopantothenoylcysteine decarboxylase/phosphopantothenoylcysteine decarboxylase/phosphopantothenate--cysteine ligase
VNEWDQGMIHIDVKNEASVFAIVPATANIIGKMANGIADDAVSSAYLAMECPVIVAPAMNPNMYKSKPVQRNLKILKEDGVIVIDPMVGEVVCGDVGPGKMAEVQQIEKIILEYHYKNEGI